MQRFTEIYFDDALRFAQYLQATLGGTIEIVREDSEDFPMPAKGRTMGAMVDCFKVRNIEVAFLDKRQNDEEDKKLHNRSLYRYIIGQQIRELREQNNVSLVELSQRTGLQANNLRNIENGRLSTNVEVLCHIAEALNACIKFVKG